MSRLKTAMLSELQIEIEEKKLNDLYFDQKLIDHYLTINNE